MHRFDLYFGDIRNKQNFKQTINVVMISNRRKKLKGYKAVFFAFVFIITGCTDFLEMKPDKTFATLQSLEILQAAMDDYSNINNRDAGSSEVSADNYFLNDATFNSMTEERRRIYLWKDSHFFSGVLTDWNRLYSTVNIANSVLDNLKGIERTRTNAMQWDNILGQASFIRGKAFLELVGIWSLAYDELYADRDLGIPLRLDADFNVPSVRSSVKASYDQIIEDLNNACIRLPTTGVHVMRPSKPAAYALLSRTYLFMRKYELAAAYADSCLALRSELLDFNTLDSTANYPIPQFNEEIFFYSQMTLPNHLAQSRANIDTLLLASFEGGDLRKSIFFRDNEDGLSTFKGSFSGSGALFSGISANEVYLTLAECEVRIGNRQKALGLLNELLKHRWQNDVFVPVEANDSKHLLEVILTERRKELLMRGIRWMDIKRLNMEGHDIKLRRIVNGELQELHPNDLRYALPLPEDVVAISGMKQNPR